MLEFIIQGLIVASCAAVFLVGSLDPKVRMWAGIIGLAGQPLYLYSTFTNGQWGMFIAAIVFTFSWGRVFLNNLQEYRRQIDWRVCRD